MANNEIKTNAEIYREQRKERLDKAAKKKHSAKRDKAVRIIVKTVISIICVSLALYFTGNMLLNVFNVPQKVLTVASYGDEKLSGTEYNYYYMSLYNQIYQMSYEYENAYSSYGQGYGSYFTGFDMSKDPAEQDYPHDDAPETVKTWSDYFAEMATTRAFLMDEMYKKATGEEGKKLGFELSKEKKTEIKESIDETISTLEENAKKENFSLDSYIARACGEGLTEESYRALLEKDSIAQEYLTWYQEYLNTSYTDKEIEAYFAENRADFVTVSARIFSVSYAEPAKDSTDPSYTREEAQERANEFKEKINNEEDFISLAKEYAPPSMAEAYADDTATLVTDAYAADVPAGESVTNWLFSEKRQVSESAVIEDKETKEFYIIYVLKPSERDEGVSKASVRHILFSAETTDEEGNALEQAVIEKNLETAKAKADKVVKTWKEKGANEKAFIALVADNTDDPGSAETGGLYDDVTADSSYVDEFKNWALDEARKPGDTELVKTQFGYHFMYFVEAAEDSVWENDVRTTLASTDYDKLVDASYEDIEEKAEKNDEFLKFFSKRLQESISMRY